VSEAALPPLSPGAATKAAKFMGMFKAIQPALLPDAMPSPQAVPQRVEVASVLPPVSRPHVVATSAPIDALRELEAMRNGDHLSRRLKALTTPRPKQPELDVDTAADILACQMLPRKIHTAVRETFTALVRIALEHARLKGYSGAVSTVRFHLVQELLASHLDVSRETLWRHLNQLQKLGVLNRESHKTTSRGTVISDGTLWAIKVAPNVQGRPLLRREDFKAQYRDLDADRKANRTAWARLGGFAKKQLQQSEERLKTAVKAEELVAWTLTPGFLEQTPLSVTVARPAAVGRTAVWDVKNVPLVSKQERGAVVDRVAHSLADAMQDSSVNWYRWMLWQLLRLSDAGHDHWQNFTALLERVQTDIQEGYAQKPGALFTARFKELGFYDLLNNAPPHRVGATPKGEA